MNFSVDNQGIDNFLRTRFVSGAFLQSTFWEEFLREQGLRLWRINIVEKGEAMATCLVYEKKLPLEKSYLYAPKGPIFSGVENEVKQEALRHLLGKVRDVTASTLRYDEIFFRMELEDASQLVNGLKKGEDVQPRETWVLFLDKTEEQMLADMHQKARYNINLARKKGVAVRFSEDPKDMDIFLGLMGKTVERNQISAHPSKHYRQLYQVLIERKAGYLAIAEKDGQALAANLMINFGPATTYVHGASDYASRQLMAPHLLQWQSILRAKQDGYLVYDFWGVAPQDGTKSTWEGFSRFKQSFGGTRITAAGAYDMVYDSGMYWLYNFSRKLRKALRP